MKKKKEKQQLATWQLSNSEVKVSIAEYETNSEFFSYTTSNSDGTKKLMENANGSGVKAFYIYGS